MAINKECFIKSVKSDYTAIGKIILAIAVFMAVAYNASTIAGLICYIRDLIKVPSSFWSILVCVVGMLFMLYMTASQNKDEVKGDKLGFMWVLCGVLIALVWVITLAPYILYMIWFNVPDVERQAYLVETFMGFAVIVGIVLPALLPLALGYARCKETAESTSPKGGNDAV